MIHHPAAKNMSWTHTGTYNIYTVSNLVRGFIRQMNRVNQSSSILKLSALFDCIEVDKLLPSDSWIYRNPIIDHLMKPVCMSMSCA